MKDPDQDLVHHLSSMSARAALNYVAEQNLPLEWRTPLLTKADQLRAARTKTKRRVKALQIQHAELWYRIIAPLKYELSNAKVGLQLKPFSEAPERHTAFTEYVALLEKLLVGLQRLQATEYQKISSTGDRGNPKTPGELAQERGLPKRGEHWVDWINERTKARISMLFDAIPWGVKRPKPFARRIPPTNFTKDIATLQKRTIHELENARQEMEMLEAVEKPTLEQEARLAKLQDEVTGMQAALSQTVHMHNVPVPFTWRGVEVSPEDWGRRMAQAAEVEKMLRAKFEPTEEDIRAARQNKGRKRPRRYVK